MSPVCPNLSRLVLGPACAAWGGGVGLAEAIAIIVEA